MKTRMTLALIVTVFFATVSTAGSEVKVVASTTDLASIARFIGGDKIKVESIAIGTADPHHVEVLPSYMMKVAKADIYLKVGLDLDRWANEIIDGSRNGKLIVVDCSQRIEPLQRPTTKVDASMGDIHPRGNPHYWLDPANGPLIAEMVTNALAEIDGDNFMYYAGRLEEFQKKFDEKESEWMAKAAALEGLEIVTFHNTWPYFTDAFGIRVAGFVEPKPGIPPTASHSAKIVEMIKAKGIKIIGVEPYFSRRSPEMIARMTEATVVTLPASVGGAEGADDYFSLFDTILDILQQSLED
jgi:ABC-type Zn uptake system ZnuABC Zn-binding protein ZnuA